MHGRYWWIFEIVMRNIALFTASMVLLCLLLALLPDATSGSYTSRLVRYLDIAFSFDFGTSSLYGFPVTEVIADRSKKTLLLISLSVVTVLAISLPLGIAGQNSGRGRIKWILVYPIYLLSSVPVLIWASVLMMLTYMVFNLVPIYGDLSSAGFRDSLLIIASPVMALSIGDGMLYDTYRIVDENIRELKGKTWMRGLKARGRSITGHLARGLLEPLTVYLTSKLTYLIGGAIIVEYIFNWQGLGLLIWEAIKTPGAKDYPVIIAAVMILVLLVMAASVARDIVNRVMNPQLRSTRS